MKLGFLKKDNQKLNSNIEVINDSLYALKFSFIPYISEVKYKADKEFPAYQEPARLDKENGIILLNKDHAGYELIKDAFIRAMKKNGNNLERDLLILKTKKDKTQIQVFYQCALECELERRLYAEMNKTKR